MTNNIKDWPLQILHLLYVEWRHVELYILWLIDAYSFCFYFVRAKIKFDTEKSAGIILFFLATAKLGDNEFGSVWPFLILFMSGKTVSTSA